MGPAPAAISPCLHRPAACLNTAVFRHCLPVASGGDPALHTTAVCDGWSEAPTSCPACGPTRTLLQARALVTDIYMGSSNPAASFRGVISGRLNSASSNGELFNYGNLDALTVGLGTNLVCPSIDT